MLTRRFGFWGQPANLSSIDQSRSLTYKSRLHNFFCDVVASLTRTIGIFHFIFTPVFCTGLAQYVSSEERHWESLWGFVFKIYAVLLASKHHMIPASSIRGLKFFFSHSVASQTLATPPFTQVVCCSGHKDRTRFADRHRDRRGHPEHYWSFRSGYTAPRSTQLISCFQQAIQST